MTSRLNYKKLAPETYALISAIDQYAKASGLEPILIELVKTRVSQLNHCAYCIDMHTIDARNLGETEQRLYTLSAWKEAPFYTARERAALAWAEAVTLLSQNDVPDAVYEEALQHFTEKELISLNMAVIAINSWNRIAVSFRFEAGHYHPKQRST